MPIVCPLLALKLIDIVCCQCNMAYFIFNSLDKSYLNVWLILYSVDMTIRNLFALDLPTHVARPLTKFQQNRFDFLTIRHYFSFLEFTA